MKKGLILVLFLIAAVSVRGNKALAASYEAEAGKKTVAVPTVTMTPTPKPAPLKVVIPIEKMGKVIPWLSLDEKVIPLTTFIGINSSVPPFDNPLVRKAFSLGIDRQRISDGEKTRGRDSSVPATSFIPPQVLGVDLYKAVGLDYNPEAAKAALKEAGFPDASKLPIVDFVFFKGSTELAKAYQEMWKNTLGVNVILVPVESGKELIKYIGEKKPGLFILGVWIADYIDPHNFTFDTFLHPDSNYPKLVDSEFEEIITKAKVAVSTPSERQRLYIEAEKMLCEVKVYVIPVTHALLIK